MDSGLHHHNQLQQQLMNSGLTRYRSAPSSYFSNLINSGIYGDDDIEPFFNPGASSPETEPILSRFMSSGGGGGVGDDNSSSHQTLGQIGGSEPQIMDSMKQEQVTFSSQSQQQQQMICRNQAQSQQADRNNNPVVSSSSSAMDDPLMAMNPPTNLLRQSSSPAGFFAHVNIDNGYSMMRSMDNLRAASGSMPDSSFSSAKGLKSQMSFASGSHSSSRPLSRISENEGKTMGISGAHGGFDDTHPNDGGYVASFHGGSWDEPAISSDGFLKELGESDRNTFSSLNSSQNQNDDRRIHAPSTLTHHLSLPTSSAEFSAMDKLLQFQDSVPLRSRAKRGCATHPRSIAERVRRTRISERMRRLQELVPNMDKQTNTADMLDLAVDYIKELQKQVETLSDQHAKCTCPHKKEP